MQIVRESADSNNFGWTRTVFFDVFMVITIILLSLLIAIMSDTFDKVKLSEEAEMFKCRATIIDDCEASMTKKQIAKME